MSKPTTRITERLWRGFRHVTEAELRRDLDRADEMLLPVHRWSGEDRDGMPLTVIWLVGRRSGVQLAVYEVSGYAE